MYTEAAVTDISPISVCYSGCFGKLCRRHKPIAGYLKIYSQYLVDTEARLAMAFFCSLFLVGYNNCKGWEYLFFINGMDTMHVAMYNRCICPTGEVGSEGRDSAAGYGMDGHLRQIVPESFVAGAFV